MKKYMNYYPSYKDKLIYGTKKIFLKQLDGIDGNNVSVDKINCKLLIHNHTNPLNEYQEDRKVMSSMDINLKRGSIIQIKEDHKIFIVVTDVDNNKIYKIAKMRETNYILKHKTKQGNIIKIPSINSNKLEYSLGIKEGKQLVIPDDRMKIIISDNKQNECITEEIRFVVYEKIYKITHINYAQKGLKDLTLKFDQTIPNKDDIKNGIAYNGYDFTPIPSTPSTPYSIEIQGEDNCIIENQEQYTAIVKLNGIEVDDKTVVWSYEDVSGGKVEIVKSEGLECTIKGLEYGDINLIATLSDDDTVVCKKKITVRNWF